MIEILRQHTFSITFVVILFSYFLFEGANNDDLHVLNGFTMGTTYQVQLPELPAGQDRERLGSEINELLQRLDRGIFSTYAPDSELSRLNRHPVGTPFIASAEMIEVMEMAQQVAVLSGGAFDVTVGPLVNLWGFGPEISAISDNIPAEEALQEALENVGYRHVIVNASASEIVRTRDVYVDLSAIAKGYAVDELAELLDELGAGSYFLEIGGELKIKGLKPGGESWVPAIEAPVDTAPQIYEIFYSRGETIGIAGSGDYRNYFEEEGVRYSHEIDPRTGRPIAHHLAAAYVIDESTAMADALATAYMILGLDEALNLAQRRSQAAYLIYKTDDGFDEVITGPFNKYLANN